MDLRIIHPSINSQALYFNRNVLIWFTLNVTLAQIYLSFFNVMHLEVREQKSFMCPPKVHCLF